MKEIKSLARGLQILDQLLEANMRPEGHKHLGVTDLANALQISKSSASRMIQTLCNHGYARAYSETRGYVLGAKMQSAQQAGTQTVLRDLARPFLYQLMKSSGECAHTAIYAGGQALIIDDVESAASLRVSGGTGRAELLHCTAVGKCLLAFMPIPLPKALPFRTSKTIRDETSLKEEVKRIKAQGYAFDDEENSEGVRCLAAPIYDGSASAIACLGISGPTVRMTQERIPSLATLLIELSQELSLGLGYKP